MSMLNDAGRHPLMAISVFDIIWFDFLVKLMYEKPQTNCNKRFYCWNLLTEPPGTLYPNSTKI